ncbi:MAG TPA: NAD-dependent epimerase/dehydratase family protein [Vicinamibacteria bacterium]|nr:NAD-dependent epimerase/dehydratase family protein [Vicinamibacteria bacterium]
MTKTRVLVTGGAGFIGGNFARRVARAHPDWDVVVLARRSKELEHHQRHYEG